MTPWPESAPRYPSREQVLDYLDAYASEHGVTPRLGVDVKRVRRANDHFAVQTNAGTLNPRIVIVATGYNGVSRVPDVPGLNGFQGMTIHASGYRNPAPFKGKRTLVVGCGNSGAEIALDLAEHGVDVAMVVRGPVHVVPRDLFGRPSQETAVLLSRLPIAVRDAIVVPILRLAVPDLARWGITRPAMGPNRMIEEVGRVPMLDIGTVQSIKDGRIRVLPAFQEVRPNGLRFADSSVHSFDAIIFATGYKPGLERFIEQFDRISDPRDRPHRFGEETDIEGLYFVGFRNPPTGALREIGIEAQRVASSIKRSRVVV